VWVSAEASEADELGAGGGAWSHGDDEHLVVEGLGDGGRGSGGGGSWGSGRRGGGWQGAAVS